MDVVTRVGLSGAVVGLAIAITVLGGCTSDDGDAGSRLTGQTAVPAPAAGAPGDWNHDDIAFVQMMIPHHAQAVVMSKLVPTRATSTAVRTVAARIEAAQGPEILLMSSWLSAQGVDVPRAGDDWDAYDHADHGHPGMAGMLTQAQLDELEATSGPDFDRLYLRDMIAHHEGAVAMAQQVMVSGRDLRVNELAADIVAGQSVEIARLRRLLADLS